MDLSMPSPYGIFRTNRQQIIPTGYIGYWRYFKLNKDGTYFRDANGNYAYKPKWVCIPDPDLRPNLPTPPPKPKTLDGYEAVLENFKTAEDGFPLIDPDTNDVILDQRWLIVPISNFTLTFGNNK